MIQCMNNDADFVQWTIISKYSQTFSILFIEQLHDKITWLSLIVFEHTEASKKWSLFSETIYSNVSSWMTTFVLWLNQVAHEPLVTSLLCSSRFIESSTVTWFHFFIYCWNMVWTNERKHYMWQQIWVHIGCHYLNQFWFFISEVLWHSLESNFTSSAWAAILYDEFKGILLK